jgi:CheY-like chemotaxis protein
MNQKTIVIIDDNAGCVGLISQCIETEFPSAKIKTFLNPKLALSYYSEGENVDLIISDFQMPDINGVQLMHETRRFPQYADVPYIYVTGDVAALRIMLSAFGENPSQTTILEKPLNCGRILEAVAPILLKNNHPLNG